MRISVPLTQEGYDEWHAYWLAKADEPNTEIMMSDVMDMNNVLALGIEIVKRYPRTAPAIAALLPEAVERAGKELGTFMGAANLAKQIGMDPQEAQDIMMELMVNATGSPP